MYFLYSFVFILFFPSGLLGTNVLLVRYSKQAPDLT